LGNRNADAPGHFAYRGRVVHAESFPIPREDITGGMTDETVVEILARDHCKVAIGAAMKRARSPPVAAGALQLDRFADNLQQVSGVPHLLDGLIGNPPHQRSTTMVTPVPPCCLGAK